jgi:hypothetical protein
MKNFESNEEISAKSENETSTTDSLIKNILKYGRVATLVGLNAIGMGSITEVNAKVEKANNISSNYKKNAQENLGVKDKTTPKNQNEKNISDIKWNNVSSDGTREEIINLDGKSKIFFKFDGNNKIIDIKLNYISNDHKDYLGVQKLLKDDYLDIINKNAKATKNINMAEYAVKGRAVVTTNARDIYLRNKFMQKLIDLNKFGPELNALIKLKNEQISKIEAEYGPVFKN